MANGKGCAAGVSNQSPLVEAKTTEKLPSNGEVSKTEKKEEITYIFHLPASSFQLDGAKAEAHWWNLGRCQQTQKPGKQAAH